MEELPAVDMKAPEAGPVHADEDAYESVRVYAHEPAVLLLPLLLLHWRPLSSVSEPLGQ